MSETPATYVVLDREQPRPALLALETLEFSFAPDVPVEQAKGMVRSALAAMGLSLATEATTLHSYHNETALYVTARVAAGSGVLHHLNVMRLAALRMQLEAEQEDDGLGYALTDSQSAMLADVCRILGMDEGEMLFVMGKAYHKLIHGNGGKS